MFYLLLMMNGVHIIKSNESYHSFIAKIAFDEIVSYFRCTRQVTKIWKIFCAVKCLTVLYYDYLIIFINCNYNHYYFYIFYRSFSFIFLLKYSVIHQSTWLVSTYMLLCLSESIILKKESSEEEQQSKLWYLINGWNRFLIRHITSSSKTVLCFDNENFYPRILSAWQFKFSLNIETLKNGSIWSALVCSSWINDIS